MVEASLIRCATCRQVMERIEEASPDSGAAVVEFYACQCGRKLALFWEMTGEGATKDTQDWVEREIARRGSFFPSDHTANRFGRY